MSSKLLGVQQIKQAHRKFSANFSDGNNRFDFFQGSCLTFSNLNKRQMFSFLSCCIKLHDDHRYSNQQQTSRPLSLCVLLPAGGTGMLHMYVNYLSNPDANEPFLHRLLQVRNAKNGKKWNLTFSILKK